MLYTKKGKSMNVEVNFLGVFLAAVAAMAVGSVWYAKSVFGTKWIQLARIDEKKAKSKSTQSLLIMFVIALIAAYILAHVTYLSSQFFRNYNYFYAAISSSLWMWLGFVVYGQITYALFEQRPKHLIYINLGNSFVTFLAMGLVIGFIGV
jgi:hypothetical protein